MNLHTVTVPADRRDLALDRAFAGEISVREAAAIARKTDSDPTPSPSCSWCPGWMPVAGFGDDSHGMCQTCNARENAALDTREASR